MRARPTLLLAFACSACHTSASVGELRSEDAAVDAPTTLGDAEAGPAELTWRRHAPLIPCSIYAMDEWQSDRLYVGCNGGLLYRYDGAAAEPVLQVDETRLFSLVHAVSNGHVWAAALSGPAATRTTQLYRFDGASWAKVGEDGERVTALAGFGTDVWITTAHEIRRFDGTAFTTSYTGPASSEFRACTFVAGDKGWCTGTNGLAVAWNGANWSTLERAPWSSSAEVFGAQVTGNAKVTFLYGEPIEASDGNVEIRAATLGAANFTVHKAVIRRHSSYHVPRARTSHVFLGFRTFVLLAEDDQYGGAIMFDPAGDAFRPLCGPVLAFSAGSAKTRAGGLNGLLAGLVGSGGDQVALNVSDDVFDVSDLAVAPDGTAWARGETPVSCGTSTQRIVRFVDGRFRDVAAPQPVLTGHALAALGFDDAFTLTLPDEELVESGAGTWTTRAPVANGWSLFARARDDVWIATNKDSFGRFDGTAFNILAAPGRRRQIEQIVVDDAGTAWMIARGYSADDTDMHAYRWSAGKLAEWNLGTERYGTRIAALDPAHAWVSGWPARAWDGAGWRRLPFDASNVWARAPDEVYFTFGGSIYRWDGATRTRVYHGFIPITSIAGAKDRAFAVGDGGLTIEFAVWPTETR